MLQVPRQKENQLVGRGRAFPMAGALGLLMVLAPPAGTVRAAGQAGVPAPPAPSRAAPPTGADDLHRFLELERARYERALQGARRWLDDLRVDPSELRAHGIKGKKKLVELLDAYYRLVQVSPESQREAIRERIRKVVAVTEEARYHDMLRISDEWFKQDATSYLRGALLMERLGLDTRRYRDEIRKAQPRFDRHMKQRGPNQRRIFHWYYQHFGLSEPFPLEGALQEGVIAHRVDPRLLTQVQAYDLTHEVFGPYEFGERLDLDPFNAEEKRYLKATLEALTARYVEKGDPDLTAELISCLRYLRFSDLPVYRRGLLFLLESQNPDGSWGRYTEERKVLGDYVRQGFLLHTTLVALEALSVAFHPAWNK